MNEQSPTSGLDLKVLRVRNRLKSYQIAQAMGVSTSRVSALEREAVPSAEAISRYLKAVDTCRASSMSQTPAEVA